MSVKSKDTKQCRFLIDVHSHKTVFSEYAKFSNNSLVFSLSCDLSWALWDCKSESMLSKIKLVAEPNKGLTMENNTIIVGDVTNELKFYQIKD
jgi:hypothetical protein